MSTQVPKRLRFEVFKRDQFTCRYCGRKPPAVILHADHVLPICLGGVTAIGNLVASCADCNLGKSGKPLSDVTIALKPEEERERFEQMKAYEEFLDEQVTVRLGWAKELLEYWCCEKEGQKEDPYAVDLKVDKAVKQFLRYLVKSEVREAIDIAFERQRMSEYARFKFFCGICWRKIKQKESPNVRETVRANAGLIDSQEPPAAALLH